MATFETSTHPLAFAHMEGGMKTVFAVPHTGEYSVMSSGDRIEFEDLGSIAVGMVRRYDTLEALLEAEGVANVVPEAATLEAAAAAIRADVGWGRETDGVLALRVRWAKRRA